MIIAWLKEVELMEICSCRRKQIQVLFDSYMENNLMIVVINCSLFACYLCWMGEEDDAW